MYIIISLNYISEQGLLCLYHLAHSQYENLRDSISTVFLFPIILLTDKSESVLEIGYRRLPRQQSANFNDKTYL